MSAPDDTPKKSPPRPNCLAGLAGDPPYPQYGPPDPKPLPTPAEEAESVRRHAEHERLYGVVWRPEDRGESTEISRGGPGQWWLTDSDAEYSTRLTRDDLQRLRDALDKELGASGT